MKIKLAAAVVFMTMIFGCNAFAEVVVKTTSAEDGYDKIEIAVSDEKTDGWITVFVYTDNGEQLCFMDQQRKKAVNSFEFTISPEIERFREYTVAVTTALGTEKKDFQYYTYSEQSDAIAEIISGGAVSTENAAVLSLDISEKSLYGQLENKNDVSAEIKAAGDVKPENIGEIFAKACVSAALKSKNAGTMQLMTESYDEILELSENCSRELKWYADIKNKNEFFKRLAENEYDDSAAFRNEFCAQAFLFEASDTPYTELKLFIETNNGKYSQDGKVFEIDFENLKTVSGNKVTTVMHSVSDTLYDSLSDFEDAIDDAAKAAKKESGNKGSGGGGGGSSSGDLGNKMNTMASSGYYHSVQETAEAAKSASFTDISNVAWAKTAITSLADKGIINGIGDSKFGPDLAVTREQIAKMVVIAFGYEANAKETAFEDAIDGSWYIPYIESGNKNGIMIGRGSSFGIGEAVSRQDVAVVLYRILTSKGKATQAKEEVFFADSAEISDYAVEALQGLYSLGLISGTGGDCISPKRFATRAETAKLIYDVLEYAGK